MISKKPEFKLQWMFNCLYSLKYLNNSYHCLKSKVEKAGLYFYYFRLDLRMSINNLKTWKRF